MALTVGLCWLATRWDVSSAIVPGNFAGYGAAGLYGEWRVRRWDRAHDARAASASIDGSEQFFAVRR